MTVEKERFEKWFKLEYGARYDVAWKAWKAARREG